MSRVRYMYVCAYVCARVYTYACTFHVFHVFTFVHVCVCIRLFDCRYTWIRDAQRPCSKRTSRLKRKELADAITQLLLGNLPSDQRSQVEAELLVKNQKKQMMDNTLHQLIQTGPVKYARRAPTGRPAGIKASAKESAQSPTQVLKIYAELTTSFDKGCGKDTFIFNHRVGVPYKKNCTTTCTIHIVDPGVVYKIPTPCPHCGFGVQTKSKGWMPVPRVAMAIASTEYFGGRRYECCACGQSFASYLPKVMKKSHPPVHPHPTSQSYNVSVLHTAGNENVDDASH